jgi:hypothetical protein
MEDLLCPNTPKCPIFNGILSGTQYTDTYKRLYCESGLASRQKCMRFNISQVMGSCPPNVLPNSTRSMEAIIAEMRTIDKVN